MQKTLLISAACLFSVSAAQAASDVTLLSVTPAEGAVITSVDQAFEVTFSAGVELNPAVSSVWVDPYGFSEDYWAAFVPKLTSNADKTVWTIAIDTDDEYYTFYKPYLKDVLYLRVAGTDLQGEPLAGTKQITYMDYDTYEDLTCGCWQFAYSYQETVVEHGVSDITLVSLTPESGTHITSHSLEFVATFTGGVNLDSRSGIYAETAYYGLSKIDGCELTPNDDHTVWTITATAEQVGTPDSLYVRVSGFDLQGDSLQAGAIHEHYVDSWFGDVIDRYYWQNDYAYGTTYSLGFEPAPDEDEVAAILDEFSQFTIVAPAGTTINTDLPDMVITLLNYDTYKDFTDITAEMCQQDAEGNFVFTLPQPFSKTGYTYLVNVPDGFFLMPDGEWSRGFDAMVYVMGVRAEYKPASTNPAAGFVTSLTTIDLNFDEFTDMDVNTAKAELLDQDGNVASTISWGYKGNDGLGFVLQLDEDMTGRYGTYTLSIAEGSFGNGTWVDEVDIDGNHIDGLCNPQLSYEFTLYDESNVQMIGSASCDVLIMSDYVSWDSYSMDTISTHIEFYDNGTAVVKKFAGVIRYDLGFNLTTGAITNASKIETEQPFEGWTYTYYTVPTGREDMPTFVFLNDGWNSYSHNTYFDEWWCDRFGIPVGSTVINFQGVEAYNAEGEACYQDGFMSILQYPASEDQSIESVVNDGSATVRFYHLNGTPARSDEKGLLIMKRGKEVCRVYMM